MCSKVLTITFVMTICSATTLADVSVPPGFRVRQIAGAPPSNDRMRLEAVGIPSYGEGVYGAFNNNGTLVVVRIDEDGFEPVATSGGYTPDDLTVDIKFDTFDVLGESLWGSFRIAPTDTDPPANEILKIGSSGSVGVAETIPGFVAARMAISSGADNYLPGAYLYDGDITGGTRMFHFDGGNVTQLSANLVPPGRTDVDVQGMEFDPTGQFSDLLVVVDSDDHDQVSAIYGLKPNLTWTTIAPPVSLDQRAYRGMAFTGGGIFNAGLFVTESITDNVFKVAANGNHILFAAGFNGIDDIAITADGMQMYVTDADGIHLIDEAPVAETVLAACVSVSAGTAQFVQTGAPVVVGQTVIGRSAASDVIARLGSISCIAPAEPVMVIPGDCDDDGDVDLADYVCFRSCVSGPDDTASADCDDVDFDSDNDVDLIDWGRFQAAFTG